MKKIILLSMITINIITNANTIDKASPEVLLNAYELTIEKEKTQINTTFKEMHEIKQKQLEILERLTAIDKQQKIMEDYRIQECEYKIEILKEQLEALKILKD